MPTALEKRLAKLQEGNPGVHQSTGLGETALSRRLAMARAENSMRDELGPVAEAARIAEVEGRTHRPMTTGQTPEAPASAVTGTTPQPDSSAIADKSTRMQLERDMQAYGRMGLETAGSMVGMGAGRLLPKILKPVATAIGTGVGSLLSEPFDPSEDPLGRAGAVAAFSGLGDGIAGAITLVGRAVRAGGTELEPGARAALRILPKDSLPTAGRLSQNRTIDLAENVVENSITSGGAIRRQNQKATEAIRERIDGYVQEYTKGASRQEIDKLVLDITEDRLDSFKAVAESLYGQVDELSPLGVTTDQIIAVRNRIVAENQAGGFSSGLDKIVRAIDRTLGVPPGRQGIEAGVQITSRGRRVPMKRDNPDFNFTPDKYVIERDASQSISFREAAKLRSDLLSAKRGSEDVFASQVEGGAKSAAKVVDESMTSAAALIENPQAFDRWRAANLFWKDGADAFGEQVMQAVANARPDDILRTIMQSGNRAEQIRRFRKLVLGGVGGEEDTARAIRERAMRTLRESKDPVQREIAQRRIDSLESGQDAWDKFVGGMFMDILRGTDPGSGLAVEGAKAAREVVGSSALTRLSDIGPEALKELFPNAGRRRLAERLLRTLEITQSGTGLGVGTFATQMAQAGAVFTLVTGGAIAGPMAILATPAVMARLMRSPKFIRWATLGAKSKPGSSMGRRAWTQMAIIAASEGARITGEDGKAVDPRNVTRSQRDFDEFNAASLRNAAR